MIKIGKYKIGFAPLSMLAVFVVLSIFAVFSSFSQAKQEWPMPVSGILIVNEILVLIATLVYGILLHLTLSFVSWLKTLKK